MKGIRKIISILLVAAVLIGFAPYAGVTVRAAGVDNITARADYLYGITWVAQKDVVGWKDKYVYSAGETYRIPYGQPLTSGKYICWGVSVDAFLNAAANASSEFYTLRSNSGSVQSVYYAMDCSAFASYCWDLPVKTSTSGWAGLPVTSYGNCTPANIASIQQGDALTLAGSHTMIVSRVSDGKYEITEQTPPQVKRTWYTAEQLASKFSSYIIYRYNKRDSVTPPPVVHDPPQPPTGLHSSKASYKAGETATVSWNSADKAASYVLSLSKNGIEVFSGDNGNNTSKSFSGLSAGSYTFTVRSKNGYGTSGAAMCSFKIESIPEYYVVFDANEGTGAPDAQVKLHGTALTITSARPVRSGYEFVGWNTRADGTGISYSSGGQYTVNADAVLYAVWSNGLPTINVTRAANVYSTGKPRIEWEAVDGAAKYQVFRAAAADGEYVKIGNPTKLGQTDNNAESGSTYYYRVRTVDYSGRVGVFSAPFEITCKPARPEAKASNDKDTGAPVVTWKEAADADSYQVYYSETEDGKYKKVEQTEALSSVHTAAVVGCSYYYKVRSVDINGVAGAFSSKLLITVKCGKPSAAGTNVKSTGKPRVTWAAVTGAAKYQVYRAETVDGKYTKIGTPTSLGQTDNSAVSGKTYYYKVRAVDAGGTTGAFSEVIPIKCL